MKLAELRRQYAQQAETLQPTHYRQQKVMAEWGQWFGELGGTVVDFGNRVGEVEALGLKGDGQLAGYVVIEAADLPAAVAVAKGCPGLNYGGGVEVGSVVAM